MNQFKNLFSEPYESPGITLVEVAAEGVLCNSIIDMEYEDDGYDPIEL